MTTFETKIKYMRLSELVTGESATIVKVLGYGGFRRRIMEMGFVSGQRVEVVLNAPLRDPIEYKIMGYEISLRRSEAQMIEVLTSNEAQEYLIKRQHRLDGQQESSVVEDDICDGSCSSVDELITKQSRRITVALVGNPNSGKTSLFNAISGGHEHVGNYSGVTVGAKRGTHKYRGYKFEITDLPGTYALSAYTPEELYVRQHIEQQQPDVILNAVVASNLERNLYLTTELIDINPRMVVALNMFDELQTSGAKLDYQSLGLMLGVPMVPVEARNNKGIDALLDTIIAVHENRDERVRHIHIHQGKVIEDGLRRLNEDLSTNRDQLPKAFPPRYYAMKMLEGDKQIEQLLSSCERYPIWAALRKNEAQRISQALGEDIETAFANQKYGFISGALRETYTPGVSEQASTTAVIDSMVTHKLWGFPIFFMLMGLMFWATFSLGSYPQGWIETLVGWIGSGVEALIPPGALRDLLTDGVIGGVGAVIVFLPNIMILYLFISFMEDSGYLARAAFIMDRIMHKIGLHGKSFIPLIMGFGCNVPAIMACRTIESRSSRLITILITPFMSCSARIPIYMLLAGAFFPQYAGLAMLGMYTLGVALAVVTSRLMRRFMFRVDETPFVMELPPYRLPTWRTTLSHMWDKCAQYLRKMGGMILIASLVVWFLSYYPAAPVVTSVASVSSVSSVSDSDSGMAATSHFENSYLGRVGRACEPIFSPMGLDWKAGVALLTGVPAKEIVVSTLGVLYNEGDDNTENLTERLAQSGDFTTASALAFLVFILVYFPCIATIAAIGAEAGWRWAAAAVIYDTALAWLLAWAVYNIANLF